MHFKGLIIQKQCGKNYESFKIRCKVSYGQLTVKQNSFRKLNFILLFGIVIFVLVSLTLSTSPNNCVHFLTKILNAKDSVFMFVFIIFQARSCCFSMLASFPLFDCISYDVLNVATELLQLSVYFISNLKLAWVKMGNFTLS